MMNDQQMPPKSGSGIGQANEAQSQGVSPPGYAHPPGAPGTGYARDPSAPAGYPYYTPPVKPVRTPYAFDACDAAYACFALALGFMCWEFQLFSNLGSFIIILSALIGTALYLRARGARRTPRSIAVFVVCIVGALPLLLFDAIQIYPLLIVFVLFTCFYWVAVSTGNSVESRLSGFVLADWLNQTFAVPFSNYAGLFVSIKTASKDTNKGKSVLMGIVGLCIAIPLIIGVASLLIKSDAVFEKFANDFSKLIDLDNFGTYLLEFIIGIPVACYLFGAVCGNLQKRYTKSITREGTAKALEAAHRIPRAAIITPLIALCALYITYMAVMSAYLFSALAGNLPEGFTYAEYARKGFFELCGVAGINLFILIFTYSFARREIGEYPKTLRIFTGLLCVMTELLVVTAIGKMLLYIDAYDLSRKRVETLWFLILLFVIFLILVIWHMRPYIVAVKTAGAEPSGIRLFNAGRPIVIAAVCFFLTFCLANTDGIIAKYNIRQYQSGKNQTVDTRMLGRMSDAVLPYLAELRDTAHDESIRLDASNAIDTIRFRHESGDIMRMIPYPKDDFRNWNIQSALTKQYLVDPEKISDKER